MRVDLHTHTRASDGSLTREQLLNFAKLNGLDAVAITDHDTMRNSFTTPSDPVTVIPSVELTTKDANTGRLVHILCYKPTDPSALFDYMEYMRAERLRAGELSMYKLEKIFPVINRDTMSRFFEESGTFFKPCVMSVLQDYGYTLDIYGPLFGELFGRPDGSCLVEPEYGETMDVLKVARKSGGLVVVAHPSVYKSMDLVRKLAPSGIIDGIEIFHPRNNEEDKEELKILAEENDLIVTGGSDYHGRNTKRVNIIGSCTAPEDTAELILNR